MKQTEWFKSHRIIDQLKELTKAEKHVLKTIMAQTNGYGGSTRCSKPMFIKLTKLSSKTIKTAITKLAALKIIQRKYTAKDKTQQRAPKYTVSPFNLWDIKKTEKICNTAETSFDKAFNILYNSTELSIIEKTLAVRLIASIGATEQHVRKKQQTLAAELGYSKSTIQRAIIQLINKKIIKRTHTWYEQTKHRPAAFHILPVKKWQIISTQTKHAHPGNFGVSELPPHPGNSDNPYEESININTSLQSVKDKSFTSLTGIMHAKKPRAIKMNKKLCDKNVLALFDNKKYLFALNKLKRNQSLALNELKKSFLVKNKNKTIASAPIKAKSLLRQKLNGTHDKEKRKFEKSINIAPTQKALSVLKKWKELHKANPHLYVKHKKNKQSKTYKCIVQSLNDLFRGTLFAKGNAILPNNMKPFVQKYSLKEALTFLDRLHVQMVDPYTGIKPFVNRKANLKEFLLGNGRSTPAIPSKLLSCCLEIPITLGTKYREDIKNLQKYYITHIAPDHIFNFYETQAFDNFCKWAIPYARSLNRTFSGINALSIIFNAAEKIINRVTKTLIAPPAMFGKSFLEGQVRIAVAKLGWGIN